MPSSPLHKRTDAHLDRTLRPHSWDEYIGQEEVKENLSIAITAAKRRGEPLEHLLFYGPPGLGKSTLAHVIATEMRSQIRITSGPAIERVGDLASILTNLESDDILFIDEAHRLPKAVEETLYPALENGTLDIVIGKGPGARTMQLELPRFTLIAATTRLSLVSSPLRSRFGSIFRLTFYTDPEMVRIVARSSTLLGMTIEKDAAQVVIQSSRATPRVANRLLKRTRDFAQVRNVKKISEPIAREALALLGIDEKGLEPTDRTLLLILIEKFIGGPVGLQTLAAAMHEEEDTIAEVFEPYLLRLGFLERTPRGRVATQRAYTHLKKQYPAERGLFV
ncbi:MAG: Holliday junction branch migration DNA helicase RuvB [Parcubacteria group bacterium]|nr:Holliday junction branch migration DNA helicase RuvB [Parcubacteria group bacterium]